FVRPPEMLSEEVTKADGGEGEVNWSHGLYLTPDLVERCFGVRGLPRPDGIGPNQPFPHTGVYRHAAWLLPATVLLALIVWAAGRRLRAAPGLPLGDAAEGGRRGGARAAGRGPPDAVLPGLPGAGGDPVLHGAVPLLLRDKAVA